MKPLRHKYNSQPTELAGRKYASKAEAAYAAQLHERNASGEVIGWLEQVPIHLPGGVRYVLDYLVFESDGNVRAVEIKGFETAVYKVKARILKETHPWLPIEVVHAKAPRGKAPKPR